jgi:amylosucrase
MYNYAFHQPINAALHDKGIAIAGPDNLFYTRMIASAAAIHELYSELYGDDPAFAAHFDKLIRLIIDGYMARPAALIQNDQAKIEAGHWTLSQELVGMSLYADRFCSGLKELPEKLPYLTDLGVNLIHLMPVFQSPAAESDGGYAVSDFRKVDPRFGTLQDLRILRDRMESQGVRLMLDIVLNHTSQKHEWAEKARQGDPYYQDFFYMFDDRIIPDQYDKSMPEIFPESSPGNFTWIEECRKWVMTVFHSYQWDLNYRNPEVFLAMLDTIFFYANLGVDIIRIDAPAFVWKEPGTTCQNLPKAHTILRLIRQCVEVATPGMAILGEAIVAPAAIMKYFGTGKYTARECGLAYNATQMALQWDALATGDTRVMYAAQHELLQKPYGATWLTYTRCHDDIGLGYEDYMIVQAGFQPLAHRKFLQDYYSGSFPGSEATGALFSVNPKTQDARISGSLASLCGLEKALLGEDDDNDDNQADEKITLAIRKIILMQAQTLFIGGIPMLFYGDEAGYTNDYAYLQDPGKSYDNRWMHRPMIDWQKNARTATPGTIEHAIFEATRKLIALRKQLPVVADHKNLTWLMPHNRHIAAFLRTNQEQRLYCIFNFSNETTTLGWHAFKEHGTPPTHLLDHWTGIRHPVGPDHEGLALAPYTFLIATA